MKLALGSDHAGFEMKDDIKKFLDEIKIHYNDFGTYDENTCDYPIYAEKVGVAVASGEYKRGILICGSGIGMSMAVNKIKGIRGALVDNTYIAEMCRRHNNSNVLIMPGRLIGKTLAREITKIWLKTEFDGGRHEIRLEEMIEIENRRFK